MAVQTHVTGAALIRVDWGIGLRDLGYTANGVELTFNGYFLNVPGDQNGGDSGPPIDVQYFGETADVRAELTKWDGTAADAIAARIASGTPGTFTAPGVLLFGGGYSFRILIQPTASPINFVRCIPRAPIVLNKGTRHSRLVLEFEAHKNDAGVLYNSATA